MFTHDHFEYNPTDIEHFKRLDNVIARLNALTQKLFHETPAISALTPGFKEGITTVHVSIRQASHKGPVSHGYPLASRSVEDAQFHSVERAANALREAILAVSEFTNATGEVYDFLNLQIWQQRWRVYELWVFARLVQALTSKGASIADRSRIVDGRWRLKFTNDTSPVLRFSLHGEAIELYYQLYQGRGETGHMPDIAIQFAGQRFIAVIDPQHGYSYSRKELVDVCERYDGAFKPYLSCVCNYYPLRESEEIRGDPLSLVLYDLNPTATDTVKRFDNEVHRSLIRTFRDLGIVLNLRPRVVVLFDVSSSSSGIRQILTDAFRLELGGSLEEPRMDSCVLLFSSKIEAEGSLEELKTETIFQDQFGGGTDYRVPLRAAFDRLSKMPPPTQLWLYSDGEGASQLEDLAADFDRIECCVVIYETGGDSLRILTKAGDAKHVRLSL